MEIPEQRLNRYLSAFLLLLPLYALYGQSSPSVEERLREHAGEIAAQCLQTAPLAPASRVVLGVSGRGAVQIVENAFTERMRASGFVPVIGESAQGDAHLDASILDHSVAATELGNGKFLRTVRSVLECRWKRQSGEVFTSGPFERSAVDTVDEVRAGRIDDDQPSDGFFDTLMTPMVVVGSVVLMVYLLFTVRS